MSQLCLSHVETVSLAPSPGVPSPGVPRALQQSFALSEEWLAGFFDGECNFGIYGTPLQPRCRIGQRDDDGDLVRMVKDFLGVGSLFRRGCDKKVPGSNPQLLLSIAGADCMRLVDIFDRHPLRSKKRFEYPYWREGCVIYAAMTAHRWNGAGILSKRSSLLLPLKISIEAARGYSGPR